MSMLRVKNNQWTINDLGSFCVDMLKSEISTYSNEWLLDTSRQDNNETHKSTEMYQLLYSDYSWRPGYNKDFEIKKINSLRSPEAEKELDAVFKHLETFFDGIVCRAEVVKLRANSKIRKHVDAGWWLQYARRCHLPIITNKNTTFTVEENTIHMESGHLYEINNSLRHSVDNPTNFDRIHIIIDVMPKKMI